MQDHSFIPFLLHLYLLVICMIISETMENFNNIVKEIQPFGYLQCMRKCYLASKCGSIYYRKGDLHCIIITLSTASNNATTNESIDKVLLLGACVNKLCGTTETCVPLSNGAGVCINTVITCPSTWIRMGSNCFYFSGEKRTLIDSKLQCEASRGSLASISTRSVYNFIASKLIAGSEDFWVGAVRDSTGTWIWTGTGQELSVPYWIYAWFSNGTDEDCMRLTSLGSLFDQYCDKVYPYICQI